MKFKSRKSGEIADFWNYKTLEPMPKWLIDLIKKGIYNPVDKVYLTEEDFNSSNLWVVFDERTREFFQWDKDELLKRWEPLK